MAGDWNRDGDRGGGEEWRGRDRSSSISGDDNDAHHREPWGGGDWADGREQGSYGGSSGGGRARYHQDDHYRSWRERQIEQMDRDYEEYRRDRQQSFHTDFASWREDRQRQGGQRQGGMAPMDAGASASTGSSAAGTLMTDPVATSGGGKEGGSGAGSATASKKRKSGGGETDGRGKSPAKS